MQLDSQLPPVIAKLLYNSRALGGRLASGLKIEVALLLVLPSFAEAVKERLRQSARDVSLQLDTQKQLNVVRMRTPPYNSSTNIDSNYVPVM